jgi:hypothetical protein
MEGVGSGTDNAIGSGSIPKMAGLAGPDISHSSNRLSEGRHQRTHARSREGGRHEPPFLVPTGLLLLCALISLDATTAEAAGIGVHLRGHAQNIPRAVAGGHNPHAGVGGGAQAPSRVNPSTRSIQPDTAGESTAVKSRKRAIDVKASRQSAAPQGRR